MQAWTGRKVLVLGLGDSGLSMARWLVRHGAQVSVADTRETPAIMLLTKAEQADMFLGWSARADVFLTKPFNPMELIVHVKRLLRTLPKDEDDGGWPPNNGWFSTS